MLLKIYKNVLLLLGRRQVVRHRVLIPASVGSNPTASANYRSIAQLGRAFRLGRKGRKFKSCYSDHMVL